MLIEAKVDFYEELLRRSLFHPSYHFYYIQADDPGDFLCHSPAFNIQEKNFKNRILSNFL